MKLKDMLLEADALFIKSDIGNSRYYDEWNSDMLTAQFKEDQIVKFEIKNLMGVRTLIVKLAHWR